MALKSKEPTSKFLWDLHQFYHLRSENPIISLIPSIFLLNKTHDLMNHSCVGHKCCWTNYLGV